MKDNILNRSVKYFIGYLITDLLVSGASFLLTQGMKMGNLTYTSWLLLAVKVSVTVAVVSVITNLTIYRTQVKNLILLLKRR